MWGTGSPFRTNRRRTALHRLPAIAPQLEQAPYAPSRDSRKDGITLFTFRDLPYSPVDLLWRWEGLRQTHRGFVQPLMQALIEQMNPRARFLFLVQALEGLHTQTVGDGPTSIEEHRTRRKAILRAVKSAGVEKSELTCSIDGWTGMDASACRRGWRNYATLSVMKSRA